MVLAKKIFINSGGMDALKNEHTGPCAFLIKIFSGQ